MSALASVGLQLTGPIIECLHDCKMLCRPLPVPELGQGWSRVKHVRPSGRSEWIFHAPGGRTFRSKKCASPLYSNTCSYILGGCRGW